MSTTKSRIEWTEHTWNPVVGCTKISAGCKFCYAAVMARRLQAIGTPGYENGFKIRLRPEKLDEPLLRKTPTGYFVNSMSDLFHPHVPFEFIDRVFDTMHCANWHTFQVLTKRPERMAEYLAGSRVPDHIWLGTSVENKRHGVPRIAHLASTNAATRFLSVEPLLEDVGPLCLDGISWVIVGGESGIGARPMQAAWARSVRKQCMKAGVAFFFKQWGAHGPDGVRRSKKANGRTLDGREWDGMPHVRSARG
jgi:protein gp37